MSKIQCVNSERVELGRVVPLDTPFTLNIFITTLCNFRCNYCYHTLEQDKLVEKYGPQMNMTFENFKKIIDGAAGFPQKIKTITISGHGEPMVNPELTRMVAYAAEKKVAERIELITNASLLTHQKSDELIEGGLTKLRVSVQGVSAKKYKDISNVTIDFDNFIEQLEYFYKKKEGHNCTVYCKTVDAALDEGDEQRFYEIFEKCSDIMNIENVVKFDEDVQYVGIDNIEKNKNKNGTQVDSVNVCPIPFYSLDVFPDGTIANCHIRSISSQGTIDDITIYEAWNSAETKQYWEKLLDCRECAECRNCHFNVGLIKNGDNIDNYIDEIKVRLQGNGSHK